MSIIQKLGYKQRIVIVVSLILAVLSHFLPEPKQPQESFSSSPRIEKTFEKIPSGVIPSSLVKKQSTDYRDESAVDLVSPQFSSDSSIEHEQILQVQTDQVRSHHPSTMDQELVSTPQDLFTLPASPDLFPLQLPQISPVHQPPLNLE